MPVTDTEVTSMEDSHTLEDEKGSSTNIPSSAPAPNVPSPTPLDPTTTRPNFTNETMIEKKAVSMASNDCSLALSSPAEASPAKPAATSPTTLEGSFERSPATSHIASASDSLTCTGTSLVNISESPLSSFPSTTFGSVDLANDFPAVLTFKGVTVTLENNSVWKQFSRCGTEMILTKQGRRMFPYCRYRLAGLDPERQYSLVLSIVPSDQYRYRWSSSKWEVTALADHQTQGLIRAFPHHYSPCRGSEWMTGLVSFYKLKLTNCSQDEEGHMILHSMHRYIPRLHVIPVPDGDVPTPDKPVVMGPECMTFTFPQTEFMAVTTYQNFRITQLKINHNPFAKGFREDGNNPRLQRITTAPRPVVATDTQPLISKPAELDGNEEEVVDLSSKNCTVPAPPSKEQEPRLVLKPIMSTSKDEPYVPCIRGKHALGELVLVQKPAPVEPREETHAVSITPEVQRGFTAMPKMPTSSKSALGSSPGYRKKRRRINRHWANSRGRQWKAAAPIEVHCPSSTVAMQPELDDVEGLLFVSFTSKEALDVHVRDMPASRTPSASPVSPTPVQFDGTVEVNPETDEEKMAGLEALLLQDLRVLKHRQVIHPVLQEVGLKLSSLDPTQSIDMQYLGVHLPLPPPKLPEHDKATALTPADEGFSFISRTGKTSDITKIKGWKNKFLRSKETSHPNSDGSQKNLSAFCSNMLDEYLESEAQNISERAAAFSTNSEGSVAYQLPVKSSSYVKTLDSALKHRNAASGNPVKANKPCPLSYKPLLYSALTSPAPPLASPQVPVQAGAETIQQSASSHTQPGAQRLNHLGVSHRPAGSFGQGQGTHRPSGLTKLQLKLLQMEFGALSEGMSRTQLTPDRLSVALSVMLTKQMLPSQVFRTVKHPKQKATIPECGQEFCTLGCVCSSLEHLNRGPLHCRRPDCMFGCTCFKRKITKQLSAGESEPQIQPVYSMSNMEHVVQPGPGSHAKKLWNGNTDDEDPESVFTPKSAPLCLAPVKSIKRSIVPRPTYPMREEDKDPVYKYLESMMTCARVREFNSKPPPELTIESKSLDPSTLNTAEKTQKTTSDDQLRNYHRTPPNVKKAAEKAPQRITRDEMEARKQVEIQSVCQWDKDRNAILEALCRRMKQNRMSRRFWVGPYSILPVSKIFMRKPSGSIVTYRVHISKPSKASDDDEDEYDDSDEEQPANDSLDGNFDAEADDGQNEEPEMRYGVTPFLSGVLPAGRLRAKTKPVGCEAHGLIQVNGKSYNQARLLLGNMGSLHPANRLAAFVTGRLHPPGGISLKNYGKSDPSNKTTTPSSLRIKASGTVVPPIITARKTTDLKAPAQPPVPLFKSDSWTKGSLNLPQLLQHSSILNPFVSRQRSSVTPRSTSSPVSLTVSQSLKTPSFLGQRGTYSFRICPPANQGARGQKLPGVTLPGGFTLIQLPKPGADGAASEPVNTTNTAGVDKAPPQKDALINFGQLASAHSGLRLFGLEAFTGARDPTSSRPVEPGPSSKLTAEEKTPSDENDETNNRQLESNFDIGSDDLSSDSSDYCGDEDDELVDIETVEEARQGVAIAKMREAVRMAKLESRDLSDDFGSSRELNIKEEMDDDVDCKDKRRRQNHSVLERLRRSEQRVLFDKLQAVLQSDPRAPRSTLLSEALKEIRKLVATSKHLEEKKRRLIRLQSVYVKELSLLSGKSDMMIKLKLKEICKKQEMTEKMKWRPFFSNLLQSRAAFLQATTPKSKLQSDSHVTASQDYPIKTAAQIDIMSLIQAHLQSPPAQPSVQTATPQPLFSPAQVKVEVTAPKVQDDQHQTKSEDQPKRPDVPAQASMPHPQTEGSVAAGPQVTAAQEEAAPTSSTPNASSKTPGPPAKSFALPLIRSKTGRIILPSSLKPLGQGFYTLVVMEAKQKEKLDQLKKQPSEVDSSKNQDKSISDHDHPPDSESSRTLKDIGVKSPNSEPKHSGVKVPLAELALLNKSIVVPAVAVQAVKSSEVGGTAVAVEKTLSTARLSFTHLEQAPNSVVPNPSPVPGQRRRGRPRKHPITPVSATARHKVVEDNNKSVTESKTVIQVEKRQSEKRTLKEETKTQAEDCAGVVSDNPVPVKRGRGRPPKNKPVRLWSPPAVRAGRSPSKSNEDSPFKLPYVSIKPKESPDTLHGETSTSRPLTRGSLGKDFPSAKKRSWIDVEKELEPELESE